MPTPSSPPPRRSNSSRRKSHRFASAETVREIKPVAPEDSEPVDALSTFSVDVSAGNPPQNDSLLGISFLGKLSRTASRLFVHKQKPSTHARESQLETNGSPPDLLQAVDRNGEAQPQIDLMAASPRWKASRQKRQRRRLPYVIVSLSIHAAIFLVLSLYTFQQLRPADPPLLSAMESIEEIDLDAEFELDTDSLEEDLFDSDSLENLGEERLLELPESPKVSQPTSELELLDQKVLDGGTPSGESTISGDLPGSLIAGEGHALLQMRNAPDEPPLATFFGTNIEGNRIVFFVDNSGGMQYGGFETLVAELLKTVEKLSKQQRFYVILYSDVAYPLFYPRPANQFIRPTPQNIQRLAEWLETVELCVGNAVDEGLAAATIIRPDTMFLLTDGRVKTTRDGRKLEMLLDASRRDFPIHTFGMGTGETTQAAQQLKAIAVANEGQFRLVEISDEMKALARLKHRPYHSKQPGAVWGRKVGSR